MCVWVAGLSMHTCTQTICVMSLYQNVDRRAWKLDTTLQHLRESYDVCHLFSTRLLLCNMPLYVFCSSHVHSSVESTLRFIWCYIYLPHFAIAWAAYRCCYPFLSVGVRVESVFLQPLMQLSRDSFKFDINLRYLIDCPFLSRNSISATWSIVIWSSWALSNYIWIALGIVKLP